MKKKMEEALTTSYQKKRIIQLEEGWSRIQTLFFEPLLCALELGQLDKAEIEKGKDRYMQLYALVYDMCTQKNPYDWSEQLHNRIQKELHTFLQNQLGFLDAKDDSDYLHCFIRVYQRFEILRKWVDKTFFYINQYYVKYVQLPPIGESFALEFQNLVLFPNAPKLVAIILSNIEIERERNLNMSLSVHNIIRILKIFGFAKLEFSDHNVNQLYPDLENQYIDSIKQSYLKFKELENKSVVERLLIPENTRAMFYFGEVTANKVVEWLKEHGISDAELEYLEHSKLLDDAITKDLKVPWNRSKIMLLGPGRAGKTCLSHHLMGQPFVDTDSTIGIETFQRHMNSRRLSEGVLQPHKEYKKELESRLVTTVIPEERQRKGKSIKGEDEEKEKTNLSVKKAIRDYYIDTNDLQKPVSRISLLLDKDADDFTSKPVKLTKDGLSLASIDTEMYYDCLVEKLNPEEIGGYYISLYDFGGQDIFNIIHPFFLSKYGIYFIVFDLKIINSEDKEIQQDCIRQIKFWINSVIVHTFDAATQHIAPIALIGTNADIVPETRYKSISNLLNHELKELLKPCEFMKCVLGRTETSISMSPSPPPIIFFPVDNKTRTLQDELLQLMENVEDFLGKEEYMKTLVPLSYIHFLDRILAQKKIALDYKTEIIELARNAGIPIKNIPPILSYFYQMGKIFWINEDSLKDVVVCNPIEYFVKPVTIIICKHLATSDDRTGTIHHTQVHEMAKEELPDDWITMLETGIISKELLWKNWELSDCAKTADQREKIVSLMEFYGLAIPIVNYDQSITHYVIPALFPPRPATIVIPSDDGGEIAELKNRVLVREEILNEFISDRPIYIGFYHVINQECFQKESVLSIERLAKIGFLPNKFFERLIGYLYNQKHQDSQLNLSPMQFENYGFQDCIVLSFTSQQYKIKLTNLSKDNLMKLEFQQESDQLQEQDFLSIVRMFMDLIKNALQQCHRHVEIVPLLPIPKGFIQLDHIQHLMGSKKDILMSSDGKVVLKKEEITRSLESLAQTYQLFQSTQQSSTSQTPQAPTSSNSFAYDLFLSHNWGPDGANHQRVKRIYQYFTQQHSFQAFFDEVHLRGNMKNKLANALHRSKIFIVFLTKEYNEKIASGDSKDYCFYELDFATSKCCQCSQRILIIFEKEMLDSKNWCPRIQAEFASQLFFDLSDENPQELNRLVAYIQDLLTK